MKLAVAGPPQTSCRASELLEEKIHGCVPADCQGHRHIQGYHTGKKRDTYTEIQHARVTHSARKCTVCMQTHTQFRPLHSHRDPGAFRIRHTHTHTPTRTCTRILSHLRPELTNHKRDFLAALTPSSWVHAISVWIPFSPWLYDGPYGRLLGWN